MDTDTQFEPGFDFDVWDPSNHCAHIDPELWQHSRSHKDLSLEEKVRLMSRTVDEDETPFEELKPWFDMIQELFSQSQHPKAKIGRILRTWIPKKHHPALGLDASEAAGVQEPPRTFHRFPDLPKELRITIWEFAVAAEPRRIKYWKLSPALNETTCRTRIAEVCKESWDVVNSLGRYCEEPSEGDFCNFWALPQDLVVLGQKGRFPGAEVHSFYYPYHVWGQDFLKSRKEIGIGYVDFCVRHDYQYAFLRKAPDLESIVVILCHRQVNVTVDLEEDDRSKVHKLIMLDDHDEVEKLNRMWNGIGPHSSWLWRGMNGLGPTYETIYGAHDAALCLDCHLRLWQGTSVEGFKNTWLELLAADPECDKRGDPEVFQQEHPYQMNKESAWVKGMLAKFPKLRPAMLLTLRSDYRKRGDRYRKAIDAGDLALRSRDDFLEVH